MYRLVPLSPASDPRPSLRAILASLAAALGLTLLGLLSLALISYYLPAASAKAYWFVSRSSGVVAYVLITLSVLWGLVQSGALMRKRISPLLALGLHNYLSWAGLALAALHALILLGDSYTGFDLMQVVTPFVSTYRPIPIGLGIVGFYLMIILSVSFYIRRWIGQRSFRLLHYASFLAFALATLHAVFSGTDSGLLWWLYALSLLLTLGLTAARVVSTTGRNA